MVGVWGGEEGRRAKEGWVGQSSLLIKLFCVKLFQPRIQKHINSLDKKSANSFAYKKKTINAFRIAVLVSFAFGALIVKNQCK